MSRLLEPFEYTPALRSDDPRLGDLVDFSQDGELSAGAQIAILGFPSDEGVRINGGRPGAAEGPDRIRRWLYAMTPDARAGDAHTSLLARTVDLGNVCCSGRVAEDQRRLGAVLAPLLGQGILPILLGGGHETSFGHFLGYVLAEQEVSILNIDAHADVRPLVDGQPHSGSPFRQALEHPSQACRDYTVMGLNPHAVALQHVEYVVSQGGTCLWHDDFEPVDFETYLARTTARTLLTFDLDGLHQAFAPGVSAPNANGSVPSLWFQFALLAGRSEKVTSLDIVELNPRYDIDDRTARIAALAIWQFLRGVSTRSSMLS